MARRQTRVVEIVAGMVNHSQFFHHAPRPLVRRNREGNDFRELQIVESESQNGLGAFGCQTLSPKLRAKTPADLYARSEVRFKGRVAHSDETDELASGAEFGGEESKTVLRLMGLGACDEGIALFTGKRSGEEFHHMRV